MVRQSHLTCLWTGRAMAKPKINVTPIILAWRKPKISIKIFINNFLIRFSKGIFEQKKNRVLLFRVRFFWFLMQTSLSNAVCDCGFIRSKSNQTATDCVFCCHRKREAKSDTNSNVKVFYQNKYLQCSLEYFSNVCSELLCIQKPIE